MTSSEPSGLLGKKVRLRSVSSGDLERLRTFVNDPEVMRFSNVFWPISDVQQEEWYRSVCLTRESVWFVIEDLGRDEPAVIGTCCLVGLDWVARQAELRIRIGDRSVWGKGLGSEASRLLLEYGFLHMNLDRIWLRVLASNERAIRMYQGLGFQPEGRLRRAAYIQGAAEDLILMGLLREEWQPSA